MPNKLHATLFGPLTENYSNLNWCLMDQIRLMRSVVRRSCVLPGVPAEGSNTSSVPTTIVADTTIHTARATLSSVTESLTLPGQRASTCAAAATWAPRQPCHCTGSTHTPARRLERCNTTPPSEGRWGLTEAETRWGGWLRRIGDNRDGNWEKKRKKNPVTMTIQQEKGMIRDYTGGVRTWRTFMSFCSFE